MNYEDEYEKRGMLQKYGFVLGIAAIGIVVGAMVVGQLTKKDKVQSHRMPDVVMIRPLPPPPPPPPEPPKEIIQKMIEQEPIDQPEDKPDDHPKEAPQAAVTTNITGPGNDGFGLGGPGSGGLLGGGGSGHHSRFGWYAGEVQKTVQEALSRNNLTSRAEFSTRVRIWADISGRVTRVITEASANDTPIRQAIGEALTGLQLPEPPPREMPMPIVMRLVAHRPS
jgi:hypothetical protein